MMEWIVHWPTWGLSRWFGIIAYLLLFAGISTGVLYSYPMFKKRPKARVTLFRWHTYMTNGGALVAFAHVTMLLISTYAPYSWKEVLVPFAAVKHPVWNGLGTLALYGVALLLLSSDFRSKLSRALWFGIHLSAYPIFAAAAIHGYYMGTDSGQAAAKLMYGATIVAIVALFAIRLVIRGQTARGKAAGVWGNRPNMQR
ncbi:ferric reductase [Paenibacillus sp. MMS18-CY102]|uniref:ferric reductase n=1 Tax=Paenibacillus sp. MMS18-CY102 TaxID=2682849 RepID=UPI0013665AD8|nr:ferric reductase [Paenibacillus sp. MMS18-CY102]MWC30463.1 ferric reductase [Paenibacillus sp. MMS18-CY102]